MLNLLALIGSHILSAIAGLMAVTMISYSGYVIYDSVHTEQAAFTSWDLEQYRPVQEEEEGPEGGNCLNAVLDGVHMG